jgi:putative transposase
LDRALLRGKPTMFNTDQGSQCTAQAFTSRLETGGVPISMDGRGRVFDTIVSARFWRSVNDAHLDRHDSPTVPAVVAGVRGSMDGYNTPRLHQRLAYRTPAAVYGAGYAGANLARQPQRSRPVKTTRSMVGGVGIRGLDSAC